jgi:hypothetical protein
VRPGFSAHVWMQAGSKALSRGSPRPTECSQINAGRTPLDTSPWIFWRLRDGISQFRVLWDNQETARCEISAGVCEVYLP